MPAKVERVTRSVSVVMDQGGQILDMMQLMANRLIVSELKYGPASRSYPHVMRAMDTIAVQIQKYADTGNTEYLIDAANYCLLEALCPSVEGAMFVATDSSGSAGRALPDGTVVHRTIVSTKAQDNA